MIVNEMIKIETELRSQFKKLAPKLQELLLKDLGFLTIESEGDQLRFVETILSMSSVKQERFAQRLKEKLESEEYQENARNFLAEVKSIVLPAAKKIIEEDTREAEREETAALDEKLKRELEKI